MREWGSGGSHGGNCTGVLSIHHTLLIMSLLVCSGWTPANVRPRVPHSLVSNTSRRELCSANLIPFLPFLLLSAGNVLETSGFRLTFQHLFSSSGVSQTADIHGSSLLRPGLALWHMLLNSVHPVVGGSSPSREFYAIWGITPGSTTWCSPPVHQMM